MGAAVDLRESKLAGGQRHEEAAAAAAAADQDRSRQGA